MTVTQTNTSTNNSALFQIAAGLAAAVHGRLRLLDDRDADRRWHRCLVHGAHAGHYIIGIKYDTKSIAGTNAPVPADITYNFATSLGGQTGASVLLKKQ